MGTYRQPAIISDQFGLKAANQAISDFNEDLQGLADDVAAKKAAEAECKCPDGTTSGKDKDGNCLPCKETAETDSSSGDTEFIQTQILLDKMKLNKAQGNKNGSLQLLGQSPKSNTQITSFFQKDFKDAYQQAVQDNNYLEMQRLNKLVDKTVGATKFFQNTAEETNEALSKPSGGPGSINLGRLSNQGGTGLLKISNDMLNNDGNGLQLEFNEDKSDLRIKCEGTDVNYSMSQVVAFGTNNDPNSNQAVPVIGDVNNFVQQFEAAGNEPFSQSLVKTALGDEIVGEFIEKNDGNIELDAAQMDQVAGTLKDFQHGALLNDGNAAASYYPLAIQTGATMAEQAQLMKDKFNTNPLIEEGIKLMDGNYGDNRAQDMYKNGGMEQFGDYQGNNVSYDQENSPELQWQRKIVNWFLNYNFFETKIKPMQKTPEENFTAMMNKGDLNDMQINEMMNDPNSVQEGKSGTQYRNADTGFEVINEIEE